MPNVQNLGASRDFPCEITKSGANKFPNPFLDIASEYIPNQINDIFSLCEFMYLSYGTFRSAARKVVRYFLTDIVITGESETEQEDFDDFLNKDLKILTQLAEIGDEFMVYGNSFISLYFPFERFLRCPKCKTEYHVETISYKFNVTKLEFKAKCVNKTCKYDGVFNRVEPDRRSFDNKRIKLKRWNPKQIRIRYDEVSGEMDYHWEIDTKYAENIREGKPFNLNKCPWEIVECISRTKKGENPIFKFNRDVIYHLRESSLMGIPIRGWGIPPLMANLRLAYYIQILRRFDEALALDFIVPFRILFPDQRGGGSAPGLGDALQTSSSSLFAGQMKKMIDQHRKDPTSIQSTPFPVGYQMIGGEGSKLSPKDNIVIAMDELLNAVGFPAELHKGTLQLQVFPVALRLFEKTWGSLVDGYNDLLEWITTKSARYLGWGEMTGTLRSVTLADDIERKALTLQAAAGMDVSKTTAYQPLGLDFMDEQRKVVEEQKKIMDLQREAEEEAQMASLGGEMGAQGPAQTETPSNVYEQGREIAYELVTQVPENLRRGELMKIKQSNPTLHAIVLQHMSELRQELSRQGQAMMMEQVKQGGDGQVKMAAWDEEDMKNLPSPMRLSLLLSDQALEYKRNDFKKIAVDIKKGIYGADKAFSYIHRTQLGRE